MLGADPMLCPIDGAACTATGRKNSQVLFRCPTCGLEFSARVPGELTAQENGRKWAPPHTGRMMPLSRKDTDVSLPA
jgi:predicted RNA-binding Zn-ribbon protein involved in translation (DUF1610 family)